MASSRSGAITQATGRRSDPARGITSVLERPRTFVGIGLIFVPLSVVAAIAQWCIFHLTPIERFVALDGHQGLATATLALLTGGVGAAIASILTTAAVAAGLRELDGGRRPRASAAFSLGLGRGRALAGAAVRQFAAIMLLTVSVIGIPVAVWLFFRWSLFAEICVLRDASGKQALRTSSELVRGHWWRTLGFTALIDIVAALSGPLLGVALLLITGSSLTFINVAGSLIYALTVPYAALALTLYYFDLEVRAHPAGAGGRSPATQNR
ncbi:MAG TPA: hypothetical protein VEF89_20040 [Solirubrobacteraceae bacterium]|nr:hypothetical protein [Solirubrobacteraceae bacterium]